MDMAQDDAAAEALRRARTATDALYAGDTASQALGIELLDAAPGNVRVAMTVRADMVNGHGICHGGILFTLADSAFAFACNSRGTDGGCRRQHRVSGAGSPRYAG